jgi:hypothetical protein
MMQVIAKDGLTLFIDIIFKLTNTQTKLEKRKFCFLFSNLLFKFYHIPSLYFQI